MVTHSEKFSTSEVRDDFVPQEVYFSKDFARLEEEQLWPKVWQLACRLEELPNVGDYVTYEIVNNSIIVVRTSESTVKAFHNACSHRGMPLLPHGTGRVERFHCRFHGWKFNLDGVCTEVIDRHDWGDLLKDDEISLIEVKSDTWGGFVFINMDPNCQSLAEFLQPVDAYCSKFEFDKLRYRWYKSVIMPANWKLVLENFNEFYHVQQAHRQLLTFTNDVSSSGGFGRHGKVWFSAEGAVPLKRSDRLPPKDVPDFRELVLDFVEQYNRDLKAIVTERNYKASQRLRDEVEASASPMEVLTKWVEFQMAAADEDGAGWPKELTPEYIDKSGLDWHVFPNTIFLHGGVDGVLWYRVRPNGNDPDTSIFDIWALERFGEGKAPELKREFYSDWRDADWPLIYKQDFINLSELQQGVKSLGFRGLRTNPVQERVISNFHRVLRRFLKDPYDHPDPQQEG